MRLADKVATMARRGAPLPYLRRVAYLENNGSQYIDLGIYGNQRTSIEVDHWQVSSAPAYIGVCGRLQSGTNNSITIMASGLSSVGTSRFGDTSFTTNAIWASKVRCVRKVDRTGFYKDGELAFALATEVEFLTTAHLTLFRNNGSTAVGRLRVYDAKIGGDSILHLIPVLDLSGRPAMYDEVSGQFFYNQGTGEFTWGELDASSALSSTRGGINA